MVWSARTGQLVSSLQGHTDTVRSVASSPDGRCVLSLDKRGTIKAWDTRYDPGALTIKGHTEKVQKVAFSLDGSRIVSRSDRITRIWDPLDGRPASRPESDFPSDRDGTEWFSPDSKRIVSGDSEGVITIRDASSKQEILTLRGHTGRIRTVAFSPDGKRIASGSADKSVKVWDAETGQMLFSLTGHFHEVLSVAFSPDGTRLISGDGKPEGENKLAVDLQQMTQEEQDELFYGPVKEETPGEIKVWDMETGQEALSLRSHTDSVLSLAFSPDGKRIVSGSADCSVKVWSAEVQAVSTAEKP